jgi:uncharacterized protein (TIGR02118 family)
MCDCRSLVKAFNEKHLCREERSRPLLRYLAYHKPIVYIRAQFLVSLCLPRTAMVKLIALYKTPNDTKAFDAHYSEIHTPLVRRIPGLRKLEVARVTGAPIGDTQYYLLAELYFDDKDSMDRSLATPEGKATARDLASFAGSIVTMFHAEVSES